MVDGVSLFREPLLAVTLLNALCAPSSCRWVAPIMFGETTYDTLSIGMAVGVRQ